MRTQLPLILFLAATTTTACVGDDTTPPTSDEIASAIELENGGFDTTDEAPEFDQADLYAAAAIEADSAVVDEMASDPALADMETRAGAVARDLVVVWGRMPPEPTATEGRDWSGELRVSRGGIRVHRRIGFEQATDRLLPRTEPAAVRFDSVTRPFADGLALRVIDPAPTSEPLRITYTGRDARTFEIDASRLADGPLSIDAGDGNRVVVAAHRRDDSCAHGFLRGRWRAVAQNLNAYRGVVANARGELVGHIRGIAGHRRNGEPVMFGKFINREGEFVGLLKGTYEDGHFAARWLDRDGDHGQIKGLYFEGPTDRGGGFVGRWAETSCAADAR